MFDILIKNGFVLNGTGQKMFQADIGIKEDKIKKIGNLKRARAETTLEAKGLYVSPGFIDIHNHSDSYWSLFSVSQAESMIRQGVTTVIGGNCGSSLAPLTEGGIIKSIQKWADINEVNVNWLRLAEFLEELSRRKIGINFGTLVGHSTLRRGLLKDEVRKITNQEIKIMGRMLKEALQEGAFGLSTGLVYSHAKLASTEEIIRLARVVKENDGLYTSHIRGEGEELIPSINETIKIGREAKVSVEISHLKVMGRKNWPQMEKAIQMIEMAHKKGVEINFDVYPYTTTGSVLYVLLPDWVAKGGKEMLISRLKKPAIRARVVKEMRENNYDYDQITIAMSPADKTFVGRKITDIAAGQRIIPEEIAPKGKKKLQPVPVKKTSVEEAIIDILIAAEGHVIAFVETLSEENMRMALKHPLSIVGSDGSGYNIDYAQRGELVHPRCFGTFPRVLGRYVREEKLLSWEEAIAKMTGKPSQKLGLSKRGILKKGNFADITIFNPRTIIDRATFSNPYQYPEGIEYVILNGQLIVKQGSQTGLLEGRVLKKS